MVIISGALGLSSCLTTYIVDPIATPVFTAPWQGTVQVNKSDVDKLYFEGSASLAHNIAVVGTREFWGTNLTNDQEMWSIAAGKFWPIGRPSLMALAGFGTGSQRTGPGYAGNAFNRYGIIDSLIGNSDFRKYFVELEIGVTDPDISSLFFRVETQGSFGGAVRVEYLDRYRFHEVLIELSRPTPSSPTSDRSVSTLDGPNRSVWIDLALFWSIGFPHVQLYGQALSRLPTTGKFEFMDALVLSAGVRIPFSFH